MSDRICIITHDLSGIRLRCHATGVDLNWPTPLDVAHAFALERYRRLDLLAKIESAKAAITRHRGSNVDAEKILVEVLEILSSA